MQLRIGDKAGIFALFIRPSLDGLARSNTWGVTLRKFEPVRRQCNEPLNTTI
ncbi:hypothetical protein JAB6_23510 [Janthinobacterium sp. HH104]|nr:hypothetical protein JAB6_23510 [Janthinobacterium sp. HH104]